MKPLLKFANLALLIAIHLVGQVSSFWFTDSSLFQTPLLNQLVRAEQNPANPDNGLAASKGELAAWMRMGPTQQPQVQQQQQEVPQQQQQQEVEFPTPSPPQQQQQQQCQCNVDWLQNQTSSWLAKWMGSPAAQSQLRLLMSNSTGGSANGRRQQQRDAKQHHANNNSNHWAAWIRGKGSAAGSGSSFGSNNVANNISLPSTRAPQHKLRTREQQQQQQQHQVKLVQGERGPQGPKGEPGPRGEPGASGLISVRDRDALFDLPTTTEPAALTKQQQQTTDNGPARLVYIEAEQVLVVGGAKLGWRPVQLLSPLRDFRKAVSKFSISSSDELRQRLAGSFGQNNIDNSISSAPGAPSAALASLSFADGNEDEDDDDGELLDVGEEDDDDDDDDDDEDVDVDEDDDADEDDDNRKQQQQQVESVVVRTNGVQTNGGESDIRATRRLKKKKPVERQVSPRLTVLARSGAASPLPTSAATAAPVVAPVEVDAPTKQVESAGQRRHPGQDERRMKLRIAALNEPLSGNFHGIRGADFECKRNAARANVKGSFRAFLAAGYQNLNDVVRHNVHRYPVVNLRGEPLADSWSELFKQQHVVNPFSRIYSFDGRHVATDSHWPNKLVWHGANSKAGYRDMIHNCDGWHSDSLSKFGFASPLTPPRSQQQQQQPASSNQHAPATKRTSKQRKRHLNSVSSSSSSSNSIGSGNSTFNQTEHSYGSALDIIEKYPCRMPLIVLCIETIAQYTDLSRTSNSFKSNSNNNNDLETNNMVSI